MHVMQHNLQLHLVARVGSGLSVSCCLGCIDCERSNFTSAKMALAGPTAFRLLQAAGLSALARNGSSASSWLRSVHSSSNANKAAEPAPIDAEEASEPRWIRELGIVRTNWT
jgi:hypothetical protein